MAIQTWRKGSLNGDIERQVGTEVVRARVTKEGKTYELEFVERGQEVTPELVQEEFDTMEKREAQALNEKLIK